MTTVSMKIDDSLRLIEGSRTLSRPGAVIVVKELILTPRGRQAITSGSRGIEQGAHENFGPKKPNIKDLASA